MTRAAVTVAAVAVLAWLAVMEFDVRRLASGVSAAQRRDFAAADADFRAARALNPDTAPDVNRAFLYERMGPHARAAAVLEDVVRREPDNLRAWLAYALLAEGTDPAAVERARDELRRLDPLSAGG